MRESWESLVLPIVRTVAPGRQPEPASLCLSILVKIKITDVLIQSPTRRQPYQQTETRKGRPLSSSHHSVKSRDFETCFRQSKQYVIMGSLSRLTGIINTWRFVRGDNVASPQPCELLI